MDNETKRLRELERAKEQKPCIEKQLARLEEGHFWIGVLAVTRQLDNRSKRWIEDNAQLAEKYALLRLELLECEKRIDMKNTITNVIIRDHKHGKEILEYLINNPDELTAEEIADEIGISRAGYFAGKKRILAHIASLLEELDSK